MNPSPPLTDSFGRPIDYLRISVTERCDLRCAYCHPPTPPRATPPDLLTPQDIVNLSAAALRLGLRRIRLTGGEPLLRGDLEEIIARLRDLPDLQDLALTTNGQRLAPKAAGLARAGLMRINISLDSLDPQAYALTTGGGDVAAVRRGIQVALSSGLAPVKLNVVLASSAALDRAGIPAFLDFVRSRPVHLRFIEAMPTCSHVEYLPARRVLEFLSRRHHLHTVPGPDGGGPARYHRIDGFRGTIGFITPISEPFCAHCNRLRISARGELRPCLFSPESFDLLPALRGPDPAHHLISSLERAAAAKPRCYGDVAQPSGVPAMHVIGG